MHPFWMTGVRPNILVALAHLSDLTPNLSTESTLARAWSQSRLWKDTHHMLALQVGPFSVHFHA